MKEIAVPKTNDGIYYEVIEYLGNGKYKVIKKGFNVSTKPITTIIKEKDYQSKFNWIDKKTINKELYKLELKEIETLNSINKENILALRFCKENGTAILYVSNSSFSKGYELIVINLVNINIYYHIIYIAQSLFDKKTELFHNPFFYSSKNNIPDFIKDIYYSDENVWERTVSVSEDYDVLWLLN